MMEEEEAIHFRVDRKHRGKKGPGASPFEVMISAI
jgi:hypothetical protein